MNTPAKLKIYRELCGLTREELAEVAGVEVRTIRYWERPTGRVPDDVMAYLTTSVKTLHTLVAELLATDPSTLALERGGGTVRGVPASLWNSAVRQCWFQRPDIALVWALDDATAD